jgi:hypothetical protein
MKQRRDVERRLRLGELRRCRRTIRVAGSTRAKILPAMLARRAAHARVDAELTEALLQPIGIERTFVGAELDPIARTVAPTLAGAAALGEICARRCASRSGEGGGLAA